MSRRRRPAAAPGASDAGFYKAIFWTYLVLVLIVFTFVIPPFQKNDDPSHFYRTVSVSRLDLFCSRDVDGRYYTVMERKYADLPFVLGADAIWGSLDVKFSPGRLRTDFSDPRFDERVRVYDVCNLAPHGYIPNVVGFLLGTPFESPVPSIYLGRLGGVVFFVACLIASLRVAPERYRLLVYFYGALPMVLHQVSSFTYDAVQLSMFPLVFAYLTRFLVRPGPAARGELLLFMAAIWLSISTRSFAYYGILLLYFVVPADKVARGWPGYLRATGAFLGVTALTVGALEATYLTRSGLVGPQGGPIDPKEQVRFALEHPWEFIEASFRTVDVNGETILRQAAGVFGWVGFEVNFVAIFVVVVVSGLVAWRLASRDTPLLRPYQIFVLWASLAVTVVSLFFSLYVVWSPVGAPIVTGIQGRYFLGLAPFAMLAISQTAAALGRERSLKIAAVSLAVFMMLSIFVSVYDRYY